jgi:hypothetical protein
LQKSEGGGVAPSPELALEFLQKVDRKGTLRGRFANDYLRLCELHPDYVLGYLRRAFRDHERKHGDGAFKLKDPVGWMGAQAANVGKMRWQSKR